MNPRPVTAKDVLMGPMPRVGDMVHLYHRHPLEPWERFGRVTEIHEDGLVLGVDEKATPYADMTYLEVVGG